jgi:RNA polymerase sigma-70 factor (ECF subfamily)
MTIPSHSAQLPGVARAPAVAQAGAGSERWLRVTAVFAQELHYVCTSLRRLGVYAADCDDLAQEVFVLVLGHWHDYDPSRPIRPWLFAFVSRCASDWRRLARHRVQVLDDRELPAAPSWDADEMLAHAQDHALVESALEQVEIGRREVFILHDLQECPMRQIAKSLSIPLFTAYSRLRMAREEFAGAVRRMRAAPARAHARSPHANSTA